MLQRSGQTTFSFLPKHHLQDFFRVPRTNADGDFWKRALKLLEHVWQEVHRDGEPRSYLQRDVASGLKLVNGLAGDRSRLQQLFSIRPEKAAGTRERQAIAGAHKQRYTERFFKRSDARAYRRLRNPQRLGGAMKASESRDCQEGFDLGDLHCLLADFTRCSFGSG